MIEYRDCCLSHLMLRHCMISCLVVFTSVHTHVHLVQKCIDCVKIMITGSVNGKNLYLIHFSRKYFNFNFLFFVVTKVLRMCNQSGTSQCGMFLLSFTQRPVSVPATPYHMPPSRHVMKTQCRPVFN